MIGGKPAIPPTLADLFGMHGDDVGAQLRVCMPGTIWTYDSAKKTAQVSPGYSRVYNDGTTKPIPALLVDVPVITLQGGGVHLGLPVIPGDECLVVFADFNIDAWFQNGGQPPPLDFRRHDLSDGFALVGVNSQARPLASALLATEGGLATATAKVAIDSATQRITISAGGKVLAVVLTTALTALQTFFTVAAADAGLIAFAPATAAAAGAAATAMGVAISALALLLY